MILLPPRFVTVSSLPLLEKGKRQPHFLHLMWIILFISLSTLQFSQQLFLYKICFFYQNIEEKRAWNRFLSHYLFHNNRRKKVIKKKKKLQKKQDNLHSQHPANRQTKYNMTILLQRVKKQLIISIREFALITLLHQLFSLRYMPPFHFHNHLPCISIFGDSH